MKRTKIKAGPQQPADLPDSPNALALEFASPVAGRALVGHTTGQFSLATGLTGFSAEPHHTEDSQRIASERDAKSNGLIASADRAVGAQGKKAKRAASGLSGRPDAKNLYGS